MLSFKRVAVIVVPTHKANPTHEELLSFARCFKVFDKYSIKVLIPENLNLDAYRNIVPLFDVVVIDTKWLSSPKQYNILKRHIFFYNLFKEYEFLLTYELDAYVFKDELRDWCSKKFDYIGAPWFKGCDKPDITNEFIGVGNSGFSLRNIDTSLTLLKRINFLRKLRRFWFKSRLQSIVRFNKLVIYFNNLFKIKNIENLPYIIFDYEINEDYYWSQIIPTVFTDYKVSPLEEAIKFSFEVNPSLLFKMNNYQLPFGCHAWEKYEPEFWRKYINSAPLV